MGVPSNIERGEEMGKKGQLPAQPTIIDEDDFDFEDGDGYDDNDDEDEDDDDGWDC